MKTTAILCCILLLGFTVMEVTPHFDVSYNDAWPYFTVSKLGKSLENSYTCVNKYLGTCPDKIKVEVVRENEMDKIGEHVEAFSAWNDHTSAIVLRENTLKDKDQLEVVIKHEICHLGLNNILCQKGSGDTLDSDFAWMEEGICMVISEDPLDDLKVSRYIVKNGFMTTDEIASAIESDDYTTTKNGYLQSFSLCKYMAAKYGVDMLVCIIKSPADDFDSAFKMCTGDDFDVVYKEWQSTVYRSAASQPETVVISRGYLSELLEDECEACTG